MTGTTIWQRHTEWARGLWNMALCALTLVLLMTPGMGYAASPNTNDPAQTAQRPLRLGVPESMEKSGLMALLSQAFEQETGIRIQRSVGTVQEHINNAETCGLDAFIGNNPEFEYSFMRSGRGQSWTGMCYGHFLLIGPRGNPAQIPATYLAEAMRVIHDNAIPFVSSRDGSGSRLVELQLWQILRATDVEVEPWYFKAPSLPHQALPFAAGKKAYALSDNWSWQVFKQRYSPQDLPLEEVITTSRFLPNQYNLVTLSAAACPKLDEAPAKRFAEWISRKENQARIASFRYQGQPLFYPLDARVPAK